MPTGESLLFTPSASPRAKANLQRLLAPGQFSDCPSSCRLLTFEGSAALRQDELLDEISVLQRQREEAGRQIKGLTERLKRCGGLPSNSLLGWPWEALEGGCQTDTCAGDVVD